jgi:mannose-1-phosphate guanylyltransferase
LYAVIPAGGSGTRLWPLSRAGHPKFLHALTGTEASLLQSTVDRLGDLCSAETTYVVTGAGHAAAVARQLPSVPDENVIVEPSPKDSTGAIGLAAAIIARRDPTGVMGSFAADHVVRDEQGFRAAVQAAIEGARDGWLMTIGMRPTHPSTGFGYVHCGDPVTPGAVVRHVKRFKEKPDYDMAVQFVESGEYLWNASVFVWRVDVFLAELARQQPELHSGLIAIADAWDTPDQDQVLGDIWPGLPKIAIDYAVMEGAADEGKVATVAGDFGWDDIGDFHSLGAVLAGEGRTNVVVPATGAAPPPVLLHDAERVVVVPHSGRLVAAVGVRDLVIVDTADALLVCSRERAQDVKKIVDMVKARDDSSHLL